jgi:thiamine transport system substrate-binding protein
MKFIKLLSCALMFALIAAACGGSDDTSAEADPVADTDTASESTDSETVEADDEPAEVAGVSGSDEPSAVDDADATSSALADEDAEPAADDDADAGTTAPEATDCPTITLITHDSFFVSEGTLEAFTDQTCIGVELLAGGDAGQLVSSAILTKDNPNADVLFGIDNTFLQRGLDADLFLPYASVELDSVDPSLLLDPEFRVTPIDFGDVCANYWTEALPGEVPTSLDDLLDPVNAGQFVTQNPETSSPGFAFLLATIAKYGDGWEDYWQGLVDNGVSVTAGWSEAYYGEFIVGGGDRAIVMSYASSPPAEVIFADPPIDAPPTGVLFDSCYRQIEFAGVLAGTEYPAEAGMLIDFMLSPPFQEDIPLNMFVYPANTSAALPAEFVEFGPLADNPLSLTPAEIEANRDAWTERWVEIVLG